MKSFLFFLSFIISILSFAQENEIYGNGVFNFEQKTNQRIFTEEVSIDPSIKEKYDSWTNNDWKNALNRPINNWKSSLKSTLPYMKNKTDTQTISLESIPNIKRPKSSIGK